MAIDLPFAIQAVPSLGTVVVTGLAGISANVTGLTDTSQDDANGPHAVLSTPSTSGAGLRVDTSVAFVTTLLAPDCTVRLTTGPAITSTRLWVGFGVASPGDSSDLDFEGAWLRYDTATDGTAYWRAVTCDSAGTVQTTTTTAAIALSTEYVLRVSCSASSISFYVNGALVATHSSNIPTSSTLLRAGVYLATLTSAARTLAFGYLVIGNPPVVFRDAETPSGTINGSNTAFTLAATPTPAASLQLFLNGQLLTSGGADYTLSTSTITMALAPQTGDVLRAWYRATA